MLLGRTLDWQDFEFELDQADTALLDVSWWLNFVFYKLDRTSDSTRALVHILDARDFAKDSYDFASDQGQRTFEKSFHPALARLTNVESVLLDGHADVDPMSLVGFGSPNMNGVHLKLLSIPAFSGQLPGNFFLAPHLQSLIYLDISYIPGSILPLIQPTLLPALRVLKVRGRELDDVMLVQLVSHFGCRLWSLDLSHNNITDGAIQYLRDWCLPMTALRTSAHFQVEGKLIHLPAVTNYYGQFYTIEESTHSATFSHPERLFMDPPAYAADSDVGVQEYEMLRSDGSIPAQSDAADVIARSLADDPSYMLNDGSRRLSGTTHLKLSRTRVSSFGLQKLLRISGGHIEDLSCDSMTLLPRIENHRLTQQNINALSGILGAAHFFRPVFCSNLRTLRIHHSLITNIPALVADGFSSMSRAFVAETAVLQCTDEAFPQTFVPDMNPRLSSLTLTCLPRRSSGPLLKRLLHFLKLLSIQERAMQDASLRVSTRRGPGFLKGLRHLRLEFEPDPMEEGFSASEDLDAEELMNSGEKPFSFFGEEWVERRGSTPTPRGTGTGAKDDTNSKRVSVTSQSHGSGQDTGEYIDHDEEWNGQAFPVRVWAGPTNPTAPTTLKRYRKLVMDNFLREGVGPVTPVQIMAGAPEHSNVFQIAWCAAVMPPDLRPPTRSELAGMSDVLDGLKAYRLTGRATYLRLKKSTQADGIPAPLGEPHYFWTGRLEVSTESAMPVAQPASYWR